MLERLHANLHRQEKALEYLKTLLEEEFAHLKAHDPQAVVGTEFCIHELLRQMAAERREMRREVALISPKCRNFRNFLDELDPEEGNGLREIFERADKLEQRVAGMAERNAYLARGLMEQSRGMLEFLHREVQPKGGNTYSAVGRYARSRPQASIMTGRT
jgi:flagellar biosynthesis/type III secretory pathway chaperone